MRGEVDASLTQLPARSLEPIPLNDHLVIPKEDVAGSCPLSEWDPKWVQCESAVVGVIGHRERRVSWHCHNSAVSQLQDVRSSIPQITLFL